MTRVGFVLQVRPDRLDDYRAAHAAVWPDMLDALSRHGWHNYSLFLRDDGTLFGYVEIDGTFEDALAGMAGEEVNARWQEAMAPFFAASADGESERAADTMMEQLVEVFHLD
jgi:L-rhamnose mutarotase